MFSQPALSRFAAVGFAAILSCLAPPGWSEDAGLARNPFAGNKDVATEGASLLNQYCSHCHGQWAEQAERVRDLRRLRIRYGDDAVKTFWTTVTNGRLDKGMPVWKGVLPEETLWKIFTFLESVQAED